MEKENKTGKMYIERERNRQCRGRKLHRVAESFVSWKFQLVLKVITLNDQELQNCIFSHIHVPTYVHSIQYPTIFFLYLCMYTLSVMCSTTRRQDRHWSFEIWRPVRNRISGSFFFFLLPHFLFVGPSTIDFFWL